MTKNRLALLALAGLSAFSAGPAFAAGGMTVDTKGGIEVFDLDENNYWFRISGRLFVDQVFYDTDEEAVNTSNFPSGSRIRTARVGFKGGVGGDWVYKLDVDLFDATGAQGARFGEAFIGYSGCKNFWFAIGQVSLPFGLDNWAAAEDLPYMELAMPVQAFAPGRGIGLYGEWHGNMFTVAAAITHPPAGSFQYGDVLSQGLVTPAGPINPGVGPFINSDPGSEPWGITGRITFSPVHDDYTVYHAGFAVDYERLQENSNFFDFASRLEAQSRQSPIVFTNIPPNSSKHYTVYGGELAGRWGSFILQGEYMAAQVEREDFFPGQDPRLPAGSLDYYGYYVTASYLLTGEIKEYDFESGTFGGVKPHSRKGAWEIVLRHSYIDLEDNGILLIRPFSVFADAPLNNIRTGVSANDMVGSVHSTTVGLNWYVNENVRFIANYIRSGFPQSTDVDMLGLRAMVHW
jgi:phosphate-selective porin OprO/OprP